MIHPAALPVVQLLKDCQITRTKGSGPGGQHRNKVETAIVIEHLPTGIRGQASERRSQDLNQTQAQFRLRVQLALEVRCPFDVASASQALWRQRCPKGKINISATHEDFPALLAELLDVLTHHQFQISAAAETLNCSVSQLVKFCALEHRCLQQLNQHRRDLGLRELRKG